MSELTSGLHKAASNLFALYKRTHIHHFNVTGSTFKQDHSFLGDLYEQFNDIFDSTAELIRIEGEIFDVDMDNESVLPDSFSTSDRTKIFKDVLVCLEIVLEAMKYAHESAVKENSIGAFTTLETSIESLMKSHWMINSSL